MIEFLIENWQALVSLVAAIGNFLFAFLVHKRSSKKIAKLSETEAAVDDAFYQVLEKTNALILSMKGDSLDEKDTIKTKER